MTVGGMGFIPERLLMMMMDGTGILIYYKSYVVVIIIIIIITIILLFHLSNMPYGSGLGLSRCLGPGECLHSF